MRSSLRAMAAKLAIAVAVPAAPAAAEPPQVVFVCEHGSVKSLIAAEWFNRLAAERGLPVRAVSRGLLPDPAVPAEVAGKLREDGFDVAGFRPRALTKPDLAGAVRLVTIGAPLPDWTSPVAGATERWEDIPAASRGYAASRDALRARIVSLLDALAAGGTSR